MSVGRLRRYLVAATLISAGVASGMILSSRLNLHSVSRAGDLSLAAGGGAPMESPFVSVANKVLPAVVSIEVRRRVDSGDAGAYDDLFKRFFPEVPNNGGGRGGQRRHVDIPSSGSGFIVDREGHILTNNHVVNGATDITVRLLDHRSFKARLLGHDPFTDVAMVKIEGADLPVAELGNSDEMRVGDWAIAIGNPLGELEGSLTVGVVSAKGRGGLNIGDRGDGPGYQDFIQTDASINFGNSGGPLCNIRGQVVGINTAINPNGQGIGFAIPANVVRKLVERLKTGGPIEHGFIGILPQELDENLAEAKGVKLGRGVLVSNVTDASPANKAGIENGDVITEFNSEPVKDVAQFRRLVADAPVGQRVPLLLVRDSKQMNLSVILAARPDAQLASAPKAAESKDWLGLKVEDPSSSGPARKGAGRKASATGVVVSRVDESSPADASGIQEGDLITEVNGTEIRGSADFAAALKRAKASSKPIVMLVTRDGTSQYLAVKPGR